METASCFIMQEIYNINYSENTNISVAIKNLIQLQVLIVALLWSDKKRQIKKLVTNSQTKPCHKGKWVVSNTFDYLS